MLAHTTLTSNAPEIICTGTTPATISKTANIAQMAVIIIHAHIIQIIQIITAIIITTITIITISIIIAPIMHTSSAQEILFIGTTHAETSKIYFIVAMGDRPANMVSVSRIYSQCRLQTQFTRLMSHILEQPARVTRFTGTTRLDQ